MHVSPTTPVLGIQPSSPLMDWASILSISCTPGLTSHVSEDKSLSFYEVGERKSYYMLVSFYHKHNRKLYLLLKITTIFILPH